MHSHDVWDTKYFIVYKKLKDGINFKYCDKSALQTALHTGYKVAEKYFALNGVAYKRREK